MERRCRPRPLVTHPHLHPQVAARHTTPWPYKNGETRKRGRRHQRHGADRRHGHHQERPETRRPLDAPQRLTARPPSCRRCGTAPDRRQCSARSAGSWSSVVPGRRGQRDLLMATLRRGAILRGERRGRMRRLALLVFSAACLVLVLAASPVYATTGTMTITRDTTLTADHVGTIVIGADRSRSIAPVIR